MTYTTSLKTKQGIAFNGERYLKEFGDALNDELLNLAVELEQATPKGSTGELARGWDITPYSRSNQRGELINKADRAFSRIVGRPPGKQPPIQAIAAWAKLKGIPAFLVARKIGREGTERFKLGIQGNILKADPITGGLALNSPVVLAQRRLTIRIKKIKINKR